ncbi:MAG: 4-alpha-glucanotransferase, partial [Phycisphaerales bacterium]|nr:4-alpha-glucanotransferase [Phycisphaerales bacterium]
EAIRARHPDMPFFAEDLGVITDDVHALKHHFGLPGMHVLMFAFSDDLQHNAYLPHNHQEFAVVYTGTHDTNTARGWFTDDATDHERAQFGHYIWRDVTPDSAAGDLVELAMKSRARTAIIPLQDWLDLGTEARVNRPYNKIGNYRWRLRPGQVTEALADHIAEWTVNTGRAD